MAVTIDQVRAVLSPDEPNYASAQALGVEALPLLQQLVHGSDHLLGAKATYAAGMIGGPGAVAVLESAARSPAPPVRVAAAGAVRELEKQLGAQVLIHLLRDPDRGVRRVALTSAAGRSDQALVARIRAMSQSDADAHIRQEAADLLRRHP